MIIDKKTKEFAVRYVMETGFYKSRLAGFLGISRPTLDKILEEDKGFFTAIQAANAIFCKDLILQVKRKNPTFLLKTRFRDEFNDNLRIGAYDPEEEIKKIAKLIDESSSDISLQTM